MNVVNVTTNESAMDAFKKEHPGMKVLAAFGGWNLDVGFSEAADSGDMSSLATKMVQFRNDTHL
jgi:GH18 family chitinase